MTQNNVPQVQYVMARGCPKCLSPALNITIIGQATCLKCGWQGREEDLVGLTTTSIPRAQHDYLVEQMGVDLRNVIAKNMAPALLQFLQKWGFVHQDSPTLQEDFLQYLNRGAKAVLVSIVETAGAMATENNTKKKKGG